jgi:hypothetical protein
MGLVGGRSSETFSPHRHEEQHRESQVLLLRPSLQIIIIIIIIISCHRFSFFPGTSALEPVVNPTTQASSLSL